MTVSTYRERPLVLIADDEFLHRFPMREALEQANFEVAEEENGDAALERCRRARPDLLILDVMMPGLTGFEVCRELRRDSDFLHLPILMATGLDDVESIEHAFAGGATDFITKPINWPLLGHRVRYLLRSAQTAQALADQTRVLAEKEQELRKTRLEITRRLARAAEFRDPETGTHILRMSNYADVLARACGLDAETRELLQNAAPMHDIGKLGVPDSILLKPGKLTAEEFRTMQEHTVLGAKMLEKGGDPLLNMACEIAHYHHEWWNGGGYPCGLAGEAIPLMARICAIADVFDALTTRRPYKEAWDAQRAHEEIVQRAGRQFDPRLVQLFIHHFDEFLRIKETYSE